MKVQNKNLGTLSYLMHQPLSKKFAAKTISNFCKLAKAVKEKLEVLQATEMNVGGKYVENFQGYFDVDQKKEAKLYTEEMKPIYEEEIELPDLQFKLAEWPDLALSAFQLSELTELGVITAEV